MAVKSQSNVELPPRIWGLQHLRLWFPNIRCLGRVYFPSLWCDAYLSRKKENPQINTEVMRLFCIGLGKDISKDTEQLLGVPLVQDKTSKTARKWPCKEHSWEALGTPWCKGMDLGSRNVTGSVMIGIVWHSYISSWGASKASRCPHCACLLSSSFPISLGSSPWERLLMPAWAKGTSNLCESVCFYFFTSAKWEVSSHVLYFLFVVIVLI